MKLSVRDIIKAARELEPCNKLTGVDSWAKLIKILFSPWGINFCLKNKFPTVEQFRTAGRDLSRYGVYTDAGRIVLNNCARAILVGDTEAVINNPEANFTTRIMAMHGAKAIVNTLENPVVFCISVDADLRVDELRFGKRSLDNLAGVHPDLVRVMFEAIKDSPVDFTVTEGVRSVEQQQKLYALGRTRPGNIVTYVDGVNKKSNHQPGADGYGYAVDLYPCINGEVCVDAVNELKEIGSHICKVAASLQIQVAWGGKWKMKDYPHFELVRNI